MYTTEVEKQWTRKGLPCRITIARTPRFAVRCGHVGVGLDHVLYGVFHTNEISFLSAFCLPSRKITPAIYLDLRPDIDFSGIIGRMGPGQWARHGRSNAWICYPEWWFGYACRASLGLEFCVDECNSLADQLDELNQLYKLLQKLKNRGKQCVLTILNLRE